MADIELNIDGETAVLSALNVTLTSGSENRYTVAFTLDGSWADLTVEGVFVSVPPGWPRVPGVGKAIRRTVPLTDSLCTIDTNASDVLRMPGNILFAGVSGSNSSGMVRNSTLVKVDKILPGADPDAPGDGDVPQTRYAELKKEISDLQTQMLNTCTVVSRHTEDINTLSEQIDTLNQGGVVLKDELIANQVNAWLDAHPEALLAAASARAIGRISD